MRRFGIFCITFLPITLALVIEILAVFFVQGIGALCSYLPASGMADANLRFDLFFDHFDYNYCLFAVYALLSICVFGIWYYKCYAGEYLPSASKTFHPLMLGAILVLVPGTQFGADLVSTLVATIYPKALEDYEALIESAGLADHNTFFLILYSVILAPICEELIFRGVTLRNARRVMPFWPANILQAVLFGLFHGNLMQGCYAAALGIVLGFICEYGGSIYYSIGLHILFNLWGTVIIDLINFDNEVIYNISFWSSILIALPLGIIMFVFGKKALLRREAHKNKFV